MTRKITRLTAILLRQHSAIVLCLHIFIVVFSLLFSWLLRFEFHFRDPIIVLNVVPILVLIRLVTLWRFGLLHGHWRYTNVDDATDILKATAIGSFVLFLTIRYLLGVTHF